MEIVPYHMEPFRTNLSTRHRAYLGPMRIALVLVAVALLVVIAWELRDLATMEAEAGRVRPALARVRAQDQEFVAQARRDGIDLSDAALQRLARDVTFANQLIAERTFSWTKLLGELEETVPDGLAINGVQHDLKKTVTIRLAGSALNLEVVTTFTLALSDHPAFYDPELVRHRTNEQTGVVEFDLRVGYREETA